MSEFLPSDEDSDVRQFNLFAAGTGIFKKPVQAIHIKVHNGLLTGPQKKGWDFLLRNAKSQLENYQNQAKDPNAIYPGDFSVSRLELMDYMGYGGTNRNYFKAALQEMQTLIIEWDLLHNDKEKVWESCVLLPYIRIERDRVEYSFVQKIQPMLFNSPLYARLDMEIQGRLRGDSAIILYDWLNRFRDIKFSNKNRWEFWRDTIHGAITSDSYLNLYKNFKRYKLLPAISEINKETDLMVELIEDYNGMKSVQQLQFKIDIKPKFVTETAMIERVPTIRSINKEFEELGISRYYGQILKNQFELTRIEANLAYLRDRLASSNSPINNRGAYLLAACVNNYAAVTKAISVQDELIGKGLAAEDVVSEFYKIRTDDALKMFQEMFDEQKESLIAEYNNQCTNDSAVIPRDVSARQNRHLIPFYKWLSIKTWGEGTSQELVEFTLNRMKKNSA